MSCQQCKAGAPAAGWLWDPLWSNKNCINQNTNAPCTREDALAGVCVVQGSCKSDAIQVFSGNLQNITIIVIVIGLIAGYVIARKQGWIK